MNKTTQTLDILNKIFDLKGRKGGEQLSLQRTGLYAGLIFERQMFSL